MQMVGIVPLQHAFEHLVLFPNGVGEKFRKNTSCDVASMQCNNLAFVVVRFRNDTCNIVTSMRTYKCRW